MSRRRNEIPSYRPDKPRSGAKVVVQDQAVYFPGRFGSPESLAAYREWLARYLATGEIRPQESRETTVGELILAFREQQVAPRYQKNGRPTSEVVSYRIALRPVARMYMDVATSEFQPRDLKRCRDELIAAGYTRKRVNQHVQRIRRCFKWGVLEGIVPTATWQALLALEGLRCGEARRESAKIPPVQEERIEAIRPYVLPPVWTMIQLQLWTGMRPGEVRQMRTCNITEDDPELPPAVRGQCWVYRPDSHKTEHHQKSRMILLGPHARAIVEPWLRPAEPEAFLFSPNEAREWQLAQKRRRTSGNHKKRPRAALPRRAPGAFYGIYSYRRAIERACEKAFGMPRELQIIRKKRADGTPVPAEEIRRLRQLATQWRSANCWHPHQLRHNAATKIRAAYGIEVARIILGHSHLSTTEIYAEADLIKAARAIAELG